MDLDMWKHPATLDNVQRLQSFGNHLIPVGDGELASGLVGQGRMAEPEEIVQYLHDFFDQKQDLAGKQVMITAGPTFEPIDPVRFIGNRSSGKMGVALAEAAVKKGAKVKLILGPSKLQPEHHEKLELIRVETATEMYEQAKAHFPTIDIGILAAAVSDYRPREVADKKIKKKTDELQLDLVKNPDIAASLGAEKKEGQLLIGFALETDNEESNAMGKLKRKNFDFIVLNSLKDPGAGFNHNTNKISILHQSNKIKKFELKSKVDVALDILNEVVLLMEKK